MAQLRSSHGKHRSSPPKDWFKPIIACIAAGCFCLGFLRHGLVSGHQPMGDGATSVEDGVPFHLQNSVSELARAAGLHERRLTDLQSRKKVNLFMGIFTSPSSPKDKYGLRRKAIRETYLQNVLSMPNVETKFVVGRSSDQHASAGFAAEMRQQPQLYLHLDMEECYRCLPQKTALFFMAVHKEYDAEWIMKVDDDVYLAANRLLLAVEQWDIMNVDYVGCMQTGGVLRDRGHRWYEPAWRLLGERTSLTAYGSVYALRHQTLSDVIVPNIDTLRFLANEDTTIGQWMLAFNVTFFEDMRLCFPRCHPHGVAFLSPECTGLCEPEQDMYDLHKTFFCQRAINDRLAFMRSYPGHERMDSLKKYADNDNKRANLLSTFQKPQGQQRMRNT